MLQYILKDVLVAEIENRINRCNIKKQYCPVNTQIEAICDNKICAYKELLSFLDTLEMKDVDLEKEIKELQHKYKTIDEYEGYPCTMYANGIEWIAKHFFELGLKAQKGKD